MMRRVLGCALVVAVFASALLAPAAGAKVRFPRLDPSFGSGGYVALPGGLPSPESKPLRIEGLGAAPGGAVYASEAVESNCDVYRCQYHGFLARVNSDGSVATTFGGGGRVDLGSTIDDLSPAISDSEGRALVVSMEGANATVRRYLADGSVDASFGSGGSTTINCGCVDPAYRQLRVAIDPQNRIVVAISSQAVSGKLKGETLVRLLPSGALDGGFGVAGIVQLEALAPSLGIAFGANGAIYTWGLGYSAPPYLHRVSAKGRNDTAFNAVADRTLANVGARGALDYGSAALLVRPHGLLDLFGGDALLRLRANGSAEAKFGQGGVARLGWSILAATPAGNGKVLGLGASSEGVSLVRLQASGKADRSFGSGGGRVVEGVNAEEGLSLARLNGRRAQVLDLGLSECRYGGCPQKPALVRYRIGPKQG